MSNPLLPEEEPEEEKPKKLNPFEKYKKPSKGYNAARGRNKTKISDQLVNRNSMHILPVELVAYVQHLYADCHTWQQIMLNVCDKFPEYAGKLSERRLISIYESHKEAFKAARKERTESMSTQFNEDREALFNSTLGAEVTLSVTLQSEIERITESLEKLDPIEDVKAYSALAKTLEGFQKQLEKLTQTDLYRKLELNRRLLEQKRDILGLNTKDDKEKEVNVRVIGAEDPLLEG